MVKKSGVTTKNKPSNPDQTEVERQLSAAHPLMRRYVSDLRKEIARLYLVVSRDAASHLSAVEKLKAEIEQLKSDHQSELLQVMVREKKMTSAEAYDRMLKGGRK